MAVYEWTYHLQLTDANGNRAQMSVPGGTVSDATTMAQLATDMASLITALGAPGTITNAKVTSQTVSFLISKANPTGAVDAEYSGVEDGARMNFLNSVGGKGILTVPAPIAAVFASVPNEDTVDTGGPVAPLITWYEAHAQGNGAALNIYNGGVKIGRHARRRAQHRVP